MKKKKKELSEYILNLYRIKLPRVLKYSCRTYLIQSGETNFKLKQRTPLLGHLIPPWDKRGRGARGGSRSGSPGAAMRGRQSCALQRGGRCCDTAEGAACPGAARRSPAAGPVRGRPSRCDAGHGDRERPGGEASGTPRLQPWGAPGLVRAVQGPFFSAAAPRPRGSSRVPAAPGFRGGRASQQPRPGPRAHGVPRVAWHALPRAARLLQCPLQVSWGLWQVLCSPSKT